MTDLPPVVAAFDGSAEAEAALRAAANLFQSRRLVVVTVWEPGMAMMMSPMADPTGIGYAPPTGEEIIAVDRVQRDRATDTAEWAAALAREWGADAEGVAVSDDADVAETIVGVAERYEADAIVVGSRGLGRMRARMLGSTSEKLLRHADRPVLVVKTRRD
jgi:nucleotide-binding universal stress UspA family protein